MAGLPTAAVVTLIARVRAGNDTAWTEFLEAYAPLLLQAASLIERDRDAAADAFVYVCERLRENGAARLRGYDASRPGSFDAWLRVVAINLARDARRQRLGRLRPLAVARRLPPLEQRVLRLRHEIGLTLDETLASLAPEFPGLSEARLSEADALVASQLSSHHRWTLVARRPRFDTLESADLGERDASSIGLTSRDPEWLALARESRERLARALEALPSADRLLIRLHFEKGVTLAAVATMTGLPNPQAAHRRIQSVLARLRDALGSTA